MSAFKFSGLAIPTSLNPRIEFHGDEKQKAVDVKLECMGDEALLDMFDPSLKRLFYTDNGFLKHKYLGAIRFAQKVKDCDLTIGDQKFRGVTVSKFKLQPQVGRAVELTVSARFTTHDDEIAGLHDKMAEQTHVDIEQMSGDLFDESDDEESEDEDQDE